MTAKFKVGDLPPEATCGPALITQCAADVTPEPVEWLWPGRIAIGKLTLIAGEAGLGKSQLSIAMVAAVTTGGEWPCREGRAPQGTVIILSAEDGAADTVVPRLMAADADRKRVELVSAVRDEKSRRSFDLSADLALLDQKISAIGDVKLIIIDPISSYLGPKVDSHVNAAVRGVLEPVSEMAARLRIAIVAITHPPKCTGITAINRFIGSIAFVAAARAAFMVTRDPEDETRRLFLPVKNNLAPLGGGLAFRLEQRLVGEHDRGIVGSSVIWDAEPVAISADQALQAADDRGGGGGAGADAEEFLRDALAGGAIAVKDLQADAKQAGLSWATVRRAKDRLGLVVQRESHGRDGAGRWTWAMPIPARCSSLHQDAHPFKVSTLQENEHLAADQAKAPIGIAPPDGLDIPEFLRRTPDDRISPPPRYLDEPPFGGNAA